MLDRTRNPLFDHFTRRRRWPSAAWSAALLLIVACGGSTCALVSASTLIEADLYSYVMLMLAVALSCLVLALISPFVSAAVTAIGTVEAASDEKIMMLKLTDLAPRAIVQAIIMTALYRLRLLWAIGYGLLVPLLVTLSYDDSVRTWVMNLRLSFWIVLCGALLGTGVNWLAIASGVAAGLAWRRVGPAVGASLAVVLAALIALGGALYVAILIDTSSGVRIWLIFVSLVYGAAGFAIYFFARDRL